MHFLITFGNLIVYSRFKYKLDMLIVIHFHFDIFLNCNLDWKKKSFLIIRFGSLPNVLKKFMKEMKNPTYQTKSF